MCIAVVTTAHPDYPFILVDNRDEYLSRPTAVAQWWEEPHSQVLGGFDLYHKLHGTWLGITKQGRIAVLTNYREENQPILPSGRSRGEIVKGWLKISPDSDESTEEYARKVVEGEGVSDLGGFSLMYGKVKDVIKDNKGLAVMSNRTPDVKGLIWVAQQPGDTRAMSNSFFGDKSWPKVTNGERGVQDTIAEHVANSESKDQLIRRLLAVLDQEDLPAYKEGEEWEVYLRGLRNTIHVPPIGGSKLSQKGADEIAAAKSRTPVETSPGVYGTQKQIVILVDREGNVDYTERTLFDGNGSPVTDGEGDLRFQFQIEGW